VITNIHKVDEITQSPLCLHSNFTENLLTTAVQF